MSGKIYCIIGRSATGKTSVAKYLSEMGHKIIVNTTTRPIREGEVDGVDYYFLNDTEFEYKLAHNDFIEHTIYNNWYYGIDKSKIELDKYNYIAVVEVNGYKQLRESLGEENVVPIILWLPPYTRLKRAIERESKGTDATYKEICRRFLSDYDLFEDVENSIDENYKFLNFNSEKTADIIDMRIKYCIFDEIGWR